MKGGMGNGMRNGMGNGYNGMDQDECEGMPSIAYMKKMKNELESMMSTVMSKRGGGGMGGRNGAGGGPMMREGSGGGRFNPMERGSYGPMRGARRGRF